jgi:hypothetical protein
VCGRAILVSPAIDCSGRGLVVRTPIPGDREKCWYVALLEGAGWRASNVGRLKWVRYSSSDGLIVTVAFGRR